MSEPCKTKPWMIHQYFMGDAEPISSGPYATADVKKILAHFSRFCSLVAIGMGGHTLEWVDGKIVHDRKVGEI